MDRSPYISASPPEKIWIGFSFSSPPTLLECFFRSLEVNLASKHTVEIIFKSLDIRLCSMQKCASRENLSTVSLLPLFFDPPSILLISVITFLGSAFRGLGVVGSLDKASHLAKDVGELGAAIGAIHTFMGVFNEAAISQAFGFVFSAYFTGLSISLICSALANYLRSKELIYTGS